MQSYRISSLIFYPPLHILFIKSIYMQSYYHSIYHPTLHIVRTRIRLRCLFWVTIKSVHVFLCYVRVKIKLYNTKTCYSRECDDKTILAVEAHIRLQPASQPPSWSAPVPSHSTAVSPILSSIHHWFLSESLGATKHPHLVRSWPISSLAWTNMIPR